MAGLGESGAGAESRLVGTQTGDGCSRVTHLRDDANPRTGTKLPTQEASALLGAKGVKLCGDHEAIPLAYDSRPPHFE